MKTFQQCMIELCFTLYPWRLLTSLKSIGVGRYTSNACSKIFELSFARCSRLDVSTREMPYVQNNVHDAWKFLGFFFSFKWLLTAVFSQTTSNFQWTMRWRISEISNKGSYIRRWLVTAQNCFMAHTNPKILVDRVFVHPFTLRVHTSLLLFLSYEQFK